MINIQDIYENLFEYLSHSRFIDWSTQVQQLVTDKLVTRSHGDMARWLEALNQLPELEGTEVDLRGSAIRISHPAGLTPEQQAQLDTGLMGLSPWRKGPFQFFDTYIDTEWRSDWKWDRLAPHITPLDDHVVLDVGCGSGYHCWRMLGAGAKRVIGIDPSLLFLVQFLAVKKYLGMSAPVDFLPFKMEEVQPDLNAFDTVFSMGVLYHRRSPIDHLYELKGALRPGGQLVLETLVVPDLPGTPPGYSLMPEDRYAMMRNVWFIPTPSTLQHWLERCGFQQVRCVDLNQTSLDEQRSTPWMNYQSLADFLDPEDRTKTTEGYPAPLRAILVAEKPCSS